MPHEVCRFSPPSFSCRFPAGASRTAIPPAGCPCRVSLRAPVQSIPEASQSHCILPLGHGIFRLKCSAERLPVPSPCLPSPRLQTAQGHKTPLGAVLRFLSKMLFRVHIPIFRVYNSSAKTERRNPSPPHCRPARTRPLPRLCRGHRRRLSRLPGQPARRGLRRPSAERAHKNRTTTEGPRGRPLRRFLRVSAPPTGSR